MKNLNHPNVRTILIVVSLLLSNLLFAQRVPFVYSVEHTGDSFPDPVFPTIDQLPIVEQLPDPFEWSDGKSRDTSFASWSKRRAEIKAELEHYEVGPKPSYYDNLTASYSGGTLTVNITQNGETLTLSSSVTLPSGDGPFPAVIAMDFMTLPSTIFSDRNVAIINFTSSQVMAHTQARGSEPINKLYPELEYMGAYSAWPWGVSRLIDGIELVQDDLPIDLKHLAVTGCSYAGKMALWSGAMDERIALTIAQEPGGGGAAAWRVSETIGKVEKLGSTSSAWFMKSMFDFKDTNVSKLPFDHHELVAMCAPRACLVLGNSSQTWLAEEAGYVSCRAAQKVYETFGILDRFGFVIDTGHGHCASSTEQNNAAIGFVEKFLLGNTSANTDWTINTFPDVEYIEWFDYWGGVPGKPRAKAGQNQAVVDSDNNNVETVAIDASESFDNDGTIVSYSWSENDSVLATGITTDIDLSVGVHTITLTVTDDSAQTDTDDLVIKVNPSQGAYEGNIHQLPGKIESEHFDLGGNGYAYYDDSQGSQTGIEYRTEDDVDIENCSDTGGGYNLGYWIAGEWLEYTVNVTETDTFDIDLRVANSSGTKTVDIEMNGQLIADDVTIEATGGWQEWVTITVKNIILTKGEQILRITMGDADYVNINYVEFKLYDGSASLDKI